MAKLPFKLTTLRKTEKADRAIGVFKRINMHGGDRTVCWEWLGFCSEGAPITRIGNRRFQVNRLVYALKLGIPYEKVPKLTWECANTACCNPDHIVPEKGKKSWVSQKKSSLQSML